MQVRSQVRASLELHMIPDYSMNIASYDIKMKKNYNLNQLYITCSRKGVCLMLLNEIGINIEYKNEDIENI